MTKKKKAAEGKSVDVVEIIEGEEAKRKAKKVDVTPKKGQPIKDTTSNLPEMAKSRKIVCKEVGITEVVKVDIEDIKATSKQLYVDNIHSANPQILQAVYWIIMPDTRHIVARVTKEEYEYVLEQKKKATHHVSVVDCAVIPTLTYGSWKASELKKELPSPDQIADEDTKFKNNPAGFHNPPVLVEILEAEELSAASTEDEDEENWDFDDEEEIDIKEDGDEEEFELEDEEQVGDDEEF